MLHYVYNPTLNKSCTYCTKCSSVTAMFVMLAKQGRNSRRELKRYTKIIQTIWNSDWKYCTRGGTYFPIMLFEDSDIKSHESREEYKSGSDKIKALTSRPSIGFNIMSNAITEERVKESTSVSHSSHHSFAYFRSQCSV